nr:MAG TPA: hypothetical protein [Crassvirales sp.]
MLHGIVCEDITISCYRFLILIVLSVKIGLLL